MAIASSTAGRLAVISGDSRYNENVVRCGQGADLLVPEGAMARPELLCEPYIQRIVNHHTSPQEAGRVFEQTRPTLAAFTHHVMLASENVTAPTVEELIEGLAAKRFYHVLACLRPCGHRAQAVRKPAH